MQEINNMICIYCDKEMEEVRGNRIWPNRDDLANQKFVICWDCSAHVSVDKNGMMRGYAAKAHIRELRHMVLNTWKDLVSKRKLSYAQAEVIRLDLQEKLGHETAQIGLLDEHELRELLRELDRKLIGDTPEVDAFFTELAQTA